ncbi:hypothetical protein XA68_12023 [Ophiocordyceps unilateralis]|uniref:AB hydrolase-1 domain-containing protein n=1 Tax=Ophiocordyceps unilateralis TaxID=268505 RepID=A0A2A9P169_OPHUN|nr:hypothetical protein XA68_12023 [Ophiocordyceps unilateralis]
MVSLARLLIAGLLSLAAVSASPVPEEQKQQQQQQQQHLEQLERELAAFGGTNDWSCKSANKPVVLLHGLFGSDKTDLYVFGKWLRRRGYCIFALTYGTYTPHLPFWAGIKPIAESSGEIAAFINEVRRRTGAIKVDVVGHSEGAFQALYVSKFRGMADSIDSIVAIAPPTHGTDVSGLYKYASLIGVRHLLDVVGCAACEELGTDGSAVLRLNDGRPIVQPGNSVTVITSRNDEIVTPPATAFVNEAGVRNLYVQDSCPRDIIGHVTEALDPNIWNLALNALERKFDRKFACI